MDESRGTAESNEVTQTQTDQFRISTGGTFANTVAYIPDGDRYVVRSSKLGAPAHPAWHHNLVANPLVTVAIGRERIQARAAVMDGGERDPSVRRARDHHAQLRRLQTQHDAAHPRRGRGSDLVDRRR